MHYVNKMRKKPNKEIKKEKIKKLKNTIPEDYGAEQIQVLKGLSSN